MCWQILKRHRDGLWMTTEDKVVADLFEGARASLGELEMMPIEKNSTPPVAPGVSVADALIPDEATAVNSIENVSSMFLPPSGPSKEPSGVIVTGALELTAPTDDDPTESLATMLHPPQGSLGPPTKEVLLVLPQRYALIALDFSLHADSDTTWCIPDLHECYWPGVNCDRSDEVIGINWARQNLSGYVVPEISLLTELESLDLAENQLTGSLDVFWSLPRLETLYLFNNNFVGSIGTVIGTMYSLEKLYLGHNSLSGEIPEELFELDDLSEYLHYLVASMASRPDFVSFSNHLPLQSTSFCTIINSRRPFQTEFV
jgi:Leucine Rich repeats (2 copies)